MRLQGQFSQQPLRFQARGLELSEEPSTQGDFFPLPDPMFFLNTVRHLLVTVLEAAGKLVLRKDLSYACTSMCVYTHPYTHINYVLQPER